MKVIEGIVKGVMSRDPVHGYPHVERVRRMALRIARNYPEVDLEVLELAALLHDIARNGWRCCGGVDHALASAEVARELLTALSYPSDKVEGVVHAISTHSYSAGRRPETLEAKILSDADKLDALGAVGVVRVFMYSAVIGRSFEESIKHFRAKILRLPNLMYTREGREEAERRVKFVEDFLKELEEELKLKLLTDSPEKSPSRP